MELSFLPYPGSDKGKEDVSVCRVSFRRDSGCAFLGGDGVRKILHRNYWKRGSAEMVGFIVILPCITFFLVCLAALIQMGMVRSRMEYVAYVACRAAVVSTKEKAQERAGGSRNRESSLIKEEGEEVFQESQRVRHRLGKGRVCQVYGHLRRENLHALYIRKEVLSHCHDGGRGGGGSV